MSADCKFRHLSFAVAANGRFDGPHRSITEDKWRSGLGSSLRFLMKVFAPAEAAISIQICIKELPFLVILLSFVFFCITFLVFAFLFRGALISYVYMGFLFSSRYPLEHYPHFSACFSK